MPYLERLKTLKEEKDLTNAEISRLSNLPLATITRIFNGSTPNPTFETFVQIAIALGVSLDEIAGLRQFEAPPMDAPIENALNSYAELLKEKDERIKDLKEEHEKLRKEKQRFSLACACIVGFVLLLLTVDILNGHFGYFRY